MAGSFNKVFLMGNLTRDPELTYLPSNTPVVEFGLACNRKFRRQDGEMGEEVLFVDCRAFSKTAEIINQYLRKGRPIFIEGRLQLNQWEDKDGNKRSKMRVMVESFQFIDSKPEGEGGGGGGSYQRSGGTSGGGAARAAAPASRPPTDYDDEPPMTGEDIPF